MVSKTESGVSVPLMFHVRTRVWSRERLFGCQYCVFSWSVAALPPVSLLRRGVLGEGRGASSCVVFVVIRTFAVASPVSAAWGAASQGSSVVLAASALCVDVGVRDVAGGSVRASALFVVASSLCVVEHGEGAMASRRSSVSLGWAGVVGIWGVAAARVTATDVGARAGARGTKGVTVVSLLSGRRLDGSPASCGGACLSSVPGGLPGRTPCVGRGRAGVVGGSGVWAAHVMAAGSGGGVFVSSVCNRRRAKPSASRGVSRTSGPLTAVP